MVKNKSRRKRIAVSPMQGTKPLPGFCGASGEYLRIPGTNYVKLLFNVSSWVWICDEWLALPVSEWYDKWDLATETDIRAGRLRIADDEVASTYIVEVHFPDGLVCMA